MRTMEIWKAKETWNTYWTTKAQFRKGLYKQEQSQLMKTVIFDKRIRSQVLLRKSECSYFLNRKNIKANGFLVQIENTV